jgi:hypothetical protein
MIYRCCKQQISLQKSSSYSKIEGTFSLKHITHLQEIAQKICDEALCRTYARMAPVQQALGVEYLLQHQDFFQSFKYHLAKEVAETLGANDNHVQAVYLFEPATNPDAETGQDQPLDATIHLLVVVSKSSAALDAFIEALEQGLSRYLNELPSPLLAGRRSILNVLLITEESVEQRQGYASLISSILAPPFKLWERTLIHKTV